MRTLFENMLRFLVRFKGRYTAQYHRNECRVCIVHDHYGAGAL